MLARKLAELADKAGVETPCCEPLTAYLDPTLEPRPGAVQGARKARTRLRRPGRWPYRRTPAA